MKREVVKPDLSFESIRFLVNYFDNMDYEEEEQIRREKEESNRFECDRHFLGC